MKYIFLLLMILSFKSNSQIDSTILLNEIIVKSSENNNIDTFHGIDVSYYQGKIDWINIDSTISFSIFKSTEGVKRIDPSFKTNWENCNLIKGSYHFFRPQFSGIKQAIFFLSNSKSSFEEGNIIPTIDVEMTSYWRLKKYRKRSVNNLIDMSKYIENKTGIKPMIYTTGYFWNTYITPYYKDKINSLWIADHRKLQYPKTPDYIPNWNVWQYTSNGKVQGIKRKVDKNICFNIDSVLIK